MFFILLLINDKPDSWLVSIYPNPVLVNHVAFKDATQVLNSSGAIAVLGWHHLMSQETGCAGWGSCQSFWIPTDGRKSASTKCCGRFSSVQWNLCELLLYHHTTMESGDPRESALPPASFATWSSFPLVFSKVSSCLSVTWEFWSAAQKFGHLWNNHFSYWLGLPVVVHEVNRLSYGSEESTGGCVFFPFLANR